MRILWILFFFAASFISCSLDNGSVESISSADKELKFVIDSLKIDLNKIWLRIDKSNYQLTVMADSLELKNYNVVFGPDAINDKLQQGDGCTPEGWFSIRSKYPHKSWNKFMWLDYPNAGSWKKYNAALSAKKIKKGTDIGGEIGIHGVPSGTDAMIDLKRNWTAGCISLKNKDVDEIYSVVKSGTIVFIQK